MASHYEESKQRDVDRIRAKVTAMAGLAEHALELALRAFLQRDRQLAYKVILRDRRIDELEMEIDRLCLEFFVRQQPVARHLRFAYTAIKINQELERIGDYAESIARQVIKLSAVPEIAPLAGFEQIASRAIPMLRSAVCAFLEEDAELARKTMAIEDEADGMKSAINAELFQLRQDDKLPLKALTPLMTVARRFERVTDQAANICEEVIYMITGEYSKHAGGDVWRMVFVDADHRCASQMAEAIAASLDLPQFVFASAGVSAATAPDPAVVDFLKRKEIDISRAASRTLDQVPNIEFANIIVALDEAGKHSFSAARKAVALDWSGLPEACRADQPAAEREAALAASYEFLRQNISDLCKAVLADKID